MKFDTTYRVSYGDTDQMGVVYYANYLELFERGRTEMLRSAGLTYRDFEAAGYFLPVHEAHCRYHKSAHYDDLLTIRSSVSEMRGVRFTIHSEVLRDGELLAEGYVTLACVDAVNRKLVKLPEMLTSRCRQFMTTEEP